MFDSRQRRRPGPSLGRLRTLSFALTIAGCLNAPAAAHELLSWWSRDLLPVSLETGQWVELESREWSEAETYVDTLRCEILQADASLCWARLRGAHGLDEWYIQLDLERLEGAGSVMDAVTQLYRRDGKELRRQSVEELNSSAIARGRLSDPFQNPTIQREALSDSLVQGRTIRREQIVLHEASERRIQLGKQSMLYRQTLHSRATLSPDVPVFGLLSSETYSEEKTERFDADGRPLPAAPVGRGVRSWLRCLRFGLDPALVLPKGLGATEDR